MATTAARRRASTTARGLGHRHQQRRESLLRRHVDGALCWWCSRPMHRDKDHNWDQRSLAADHTITRANGGKLADRLLHATCNEQRGDGSRDHLRPALTGQNPTIPTDALAPRRLPWP